LGKSSEQGINLPPASARSSRQVQATEYSPHGSCSTVLRTTGLLETGSPIREATLVISPSFGSRPQSESRRSQQYAKFPQYPKTRIEPALLTKSRKSFS